MSAQFSSPIAQPLTPIKLWSPTMIWVSTLFFGFIAGLALASINCIRMGYPKRAYLYMGSGVIILGLLAILVMVVLPENNFTQVGVMLISTSVLNSLSKNDIENLQPPHSIRENASKLTGIGIGIGMLGLTAGLFLAIAIFLTILGF
jgi:hypothetical protein